MLSWPHDGHTTNSPSPGERPGRWARETRTRPSGRPTRRRASFPSSATRCSCWRSNVCLLIAHDPVVIDQPHGNPFPAHHQVGGIGESLSAQADREGGALLAAGRIDVTDVLALRPGGGRSGHEDGQPESGESKACSWCGPLGDCGASRDQELVERGRAACSVERPT